MSFSENSSESDWKDAKIKVKLNSISAGSGKQKYCQKFCEKWLSLFDPWLRRSAEDPNKPFCRACQCRLDCNRCHLVRHERTTKHKRNLESLITNGECAVRKELSVRQERSKYYHQRKRALKALKQEVEPLVQESKHLEDLATSVINTENVIEESLQNFQINEGTVQGTVQSPLLATTQAALTVANNPRIPIKTSPMVTSPASHRKEGLKLLMQIQQDKNELMDSFRELIGVQLPHTAPREKNHVDLFFESVSSSVKALSPKLVAEAKMRVSQLICELELRALKDNTANGDSMGVEIPMLVSQPSNSHLAAHGSTEPHNISNHPQFGGLT